jgi:acyl-CoA-binding protein
MFNSTAHRNATIGMIKRVISLGKHLHSNEGLVIGYLDRSGNVISFATYKGRGYNDIKDNTVYESIYNGMDSEKAAAKYIDLVGSLEAFSQCVLFFREKNATIQA